MASIPPSYVPRKYPNLYQSQSRVIVVTVTLDHFVYTCMCIEMERQLVYTYYDIGTSSVVYIFHKGIVG